ncbi:MAG: hypothetical protein ACI8QC_003590 [Planctomycetota bacterium]|jgi:hypothetical protein
MDYTAPKAALGVGTRPILVVRDLGSGAQLAAVMHVAESGESVAAVLRDLFEEHGAPLVIKSDNGGPLVSAVVQALMSAWGVTLLRSPPYTPSYNGSCERSLGWTKVHAIESMRARGGAQLAEEDLEAAIELQNASGAPRHLKARSPAAAWDARQRVLGPERTAFLEARRAALADAEKAEEEAGESTKDPAARARIERTATSRALCELNYLTLRRR